MQQLQDEAKNSNIRWLGVRGKARDSTKVIKILFKEIIAEKWAPLVPEAGWPGVSALYTFP